MTPARYLGPVCDVWAELPSQSENEGRISPRNAFAAHQRWAFRRWPPLAAIDYFIQRGSREDLRWPITCMLHGIDHPQTVYFVVKALAAIHRRIELSGGFSYFLRTATDDWRRALNEHGHTMSKSSRHLLLRLWQDENNDRHLRTQAFSLWVATQGPDDIEVLRSAEPSDEMADSIVWEKLARGDQEAIPAMIERLSKDDRGDWWQCGRHLWSPDLTEALDVFLERRGTQAKRIWGESVESDWITHEIILRLPEAEGEQLLLKHWDHLRFGPDFVQAALYLSTSRLLGLVQAAIDDCPEPRKLMEYLSFTFGIRVNDHPGLLREAQVRALGPYLHLLSPEDISDLWETCNDHGWFNIRRELLDCRVQPPWDQNGMNRYQAASQLDKMVGENHGTAIRYWIDHFRKADVSWSEILATLTEWLDQRRSFEALELVAAAIEHRGARDDLSALKTYARMPEPAAAQLITDTRFAVRRRSIR